MSQITSLPTSLAPPITCPHCSRTLQRDGAWPFCANYDCPRRIYGRIQKFIDVLDLKGCGEETAASLVEKQLVVTPAELFTLSEEDYCSLRRHGKKGYDKLQVGLQVIRKVSVADFFASLDIEGRGTFEAITKVPGLQTVEQILEEAKKKNYQLFAKAVRVSEERAEKICQEIGNNGWDIQELLKQVEIKESKTVLTGRTFCITGSLSRPRREIEKEIKELGGSVSSSVTSRTTHLVVNDPGSTSSKAVKARKWGISQISEDQLQELMI